MAMVRVYNDNVHPYSEQFREQLIKIPAKGFIEMEHGEALMFLGTFAPIKVDGDGQPIPEGYKMLRIAETKDASTIAKIDVLKDICQACRYEASSAKNLDEHIKATHADIAVVDEEAEREITKKRGRQKSA